LAKPRGAAVNVLDANGLELVFTWIQSLAKLHHVDELVQQGCRRVAEDGLARISIATVLELGPQLGVPSDGAGRSLQAGWAIENVTLAAEIGANPVGRSRASPELLQECGHLSRFPTRVYAHLYCAECPCDQLGIGFWTGHQLRCRS